MIKSVFLIAPFLLISSAAQAQSIPNLSIGDRQRLIRDLTPTNSQDFFNAGRAQLEREIRLLERRSTTQTEPPLKVDPKLRGKPSPTSNNASSIRLRYLQRLLPDLR
jgi:hypothetical protein